MQTLIDGGIAFTIEFYRLGNWWIVPIRFSFPGMECRSRVDHVDGRVSGFGSGFDARPGFSIVSR